MLQRLRVMIAVSVVLLLCMPSSARADSLTNYIRLTCIPHAKYAVVETFFINNVPDPAASSREDHEEFEASLQNGWSMYRLDALQQDPWTCDLGSNRILLRLRNYHEPQLHGGCGLKEWALLELLVDGEVAVEFPSASTCEPSFRTLVWITPYEVQVCQIAGTQNGFGQPDQRVDAGWCEHLSLW